MICPKCRQSLPEDSEFCQYCGSKLSDVSASSNNAAPASNPELAGKTCPFCKSPFIEGEAVVFCSHCEMPHHLECWKENGGCTTFGCTGNIGKIIGAEQKNAQSAPVVTKRTVSTEAPKTPATVPYPQTRIIDEKKRQDAQQQPVAVLARPEPRTQFSVLNENAEKVIQGNLPVMLEKTVLRRDNNGSLSVACSFRSLSDKIINAVLVDIECADIWRESLNPIKGHQYLDLRIARDELFGENEYVAVPDSNTRVIEVLIRKIMFSDGTLLLREGDNITVPSPIPLENTLDKELLDEYKSQTYQNVCFVPARIGAFWRCTCGAINREEEGECHSCGDDLESLTSHLDEELLQRSIDEKKRIQREKEERERIAREEALRIKKEKAEQERREREERLRLQREKEAAEAAERERIRKEQEEKAAAEARERRERRRARNKKAAIITSIAAVIALFVYLVGWQMIPSMGYKKAEEALSAGDYDTAYQGFLEVGGYRDGRERAYAIRYEQGETALKAKDYDAANLYFSEISGYNDSDDMAKEAIYQKAEKLLAEKDFVSANACYAEISGYKDSDKKAKEAIYQNAEKKMKEGDYQAAKELLEQIKTYKKSSTYIDTCNKEIDYAKAKTLFEEGKYKEAGNSYELVNYLDSKERAQEAYYCYAKELIEQGDLHVAYTILTDKVNNKGASSFEDSVDLANTAEYEYATDLLNAEKYKEAYDSFGNIKEYKDSTDLWRTAGYQYASQLFEKKDYMKASDVFSSLGNYKDSVKQSNESKYQQALSLQKQQKWAEAEALFTELGNYSDSAKQVKETKYQHALALQKAKKWADAEKLFAELGNYSDSTTQVKETKYLQAGSLVAENRLPAAVSIYKELGNYSDSLEQWKSTMWTYVLAHKNNDDKTTYEYLSALKRYNYKDSKKYYENLYTWRVTVVINNSETDKTTKQSSISSYDTIYCHYTIDGGPPGETFKLKAVARWPWGSTQAATWTNPSYEWRRGVSSYTAWYFTRPSDRANQGTFTIRYYAGSALIGEASIRVY